MNVLLVDDDKYVVYDVASLISWQELGIQEVYQAYGMKQAMSFFEEKQIDILVCDIEMPHGSGLELVEWLKQEEYDPVIIFLTSHARFDYAAQALRLGVNEYLLKPVQKEDLRRGIQKAVSISAMQTQVRENQKYAEIWSRNQVTLTQTFWREYLEITGRFGSVEQDALCRKYGIDLKEKYIVVLCTCQVGSRSFWEPSVLNFAARNVAAEIMFHVTDAGNIVPLEERRFLILCEVQEVSAEEVLQNCDVFAHYCSQQFEDCQVLCCVGQPVAPNQLSGQLQQLWDGVEQVAVGERRAVLIQEQEDQLTYVPVEMQELDSLGLAETPQAAYEIFQKIFELWLGKNAVSIQGLYAFQNDFLQQIYGIFRKRELSIGMLLLDREMKESFRHAPESPERMRQWARSLMERLFGGQENTNGVVDTVVSYLETHFDQEITRSQLSSLVYLNPDYLARLFRQHTGKSISEYLLEYRMQRACQFLCEGTATVRSVAEAVGYDNVSYFAKQFRRVTGQTPSEYRETHPVTE